MINIDKNAIDYLNESLQLRATGREQDWDLELSDSGRLNEFIEFYKSEQLDGATKIALMALILSSFDDLMSAGGKKFGFDDEIRNLVVVDIELLKPLIQYWASMSPLPAAELAKTVLSK